MIDIKNIGQKERNKRMFGMRKKGITFEKIGNEFGLTRERVQQVCYRLELIEKFKPRKLKKKDIEENSKHHNLYEVSLIKKIMAKKRYKGMKGEAWEAFANYIKARDKGVCITCGHSAQGRSYHAGHFIPMGVAGSDNKLGWDEDNVFGQCMGCNIWKGGWGEKFAEVLEKRFGKKFIEKLRARRHKYDPMIDPINGGFKNWEEVRDYYKNKLKELKNGK